jgi:hypothetical protein
VGELRHHPRVPLDAALEFLTKGSTDRLAGRCRDISLGGMFIQTPTPPAFGTDLVVYLALPGRAGPLALPCVVRWTRAKLGVGVQFGLLGARETHTITQLTRAAGGVPPRGRVVSS